MTTETLVLVVSPSKYIEFTNPQTATFTNNIL